jgi:hypothetical protein
MDMLLIISGRAVEGKDEISEDFGEKIARKS